MLLINKLLDKYLTTSWQLSSAVFNHFCRFWYLKLNLKSKKDENLRFSFFRPSRVFEWKEEKLHWSFFFTFVALSGSNRLYFYIKKTLHCFNAVPLVSLEGFEPPTHALEGRCSIQLSYRPRCSQHLVY